jgi:predicted Fe-S protein YdhL (DUF1289 family)
VKRLLFVSVLIGLTSFLAGCANSGMYGYSKAQWEAMTPAQRASIEKQQENAERRAFEVESAMRSAKEQQDVADAASQSSAAR